MAAVRLVEQILHSFQGYCCSCIPMKLSEAQPAEVLQSNRKKAAVRMKSRLDDGGNPAFIILTAQVEQGKRFFVHAHLTFSSFFFLSFFPLFGVS